MSTQTASRHQIASAPLRFGAAALTGYRALAAEVAAPTVRVGDQPSPLHAFLASQAGFQQTVAALCPTGVTVVHLSQDIHVNRLVRPTDDLSAHTEVLAVRPDPRGLRAALGCRVMAVGPTPDSSAGTTVEEVARLVAQVLLIGAPGQPSRGDLPAPAPTVSGVQTATTSFMVDQAFVRRYADAAADHNPIHLDEAAARQAGFEGTIAHGMSVLAVVVEDAVQRFAGGDASRVRGVGVRFSGPVRPGQAVTVDYRTGAQPGWIGFTCRADGKPALKSGWVQLAPDPGAPTDPAERVAKTTGSGSDDA